jgi:polyphosphate glucokinase
MILLGIDTGGSSMKGAPVDIAAGRLAEPIVTLPTPVPATPQAIVRVAQDLVARFSTRGPVGFTLPSVIRQGHVCTAANIDPSWVGIDGASLISRALDRPCVLLNDADAAGLAEMRAGAGRGVGGTVIVLTFGTGIGSAIFVDGKLVPNTEFGHLEIRGHEAEALASGRARIVRGLTWAEWAEAVNEYLDRMHRLFWPHMFILCGGVTENYREFGHFLRSPAHIVPGDLRLEAGIVGAALAAAESAV